MKALTSSYQQDKLEFIKNPTVAEFIGLSPNSDFSESDIGTGDDIARYSVLHDNEQLYASKCMLYMPTEEDTLRFIHAHRRDDIRSLALQARKYPAVDMPAWPMKRRC